VIRTFAVIAADDLEGLRSLGVRPLAVVAASGLAAQGIAAALEQTARRLRLEARRVLRVEPGTVIQFPRAENAR